MRKPRIRYLISEGEWVCENLKRLREDSRGEFGFGSTPKEAFIDWYIKQIGVDNE